MLGLDGIAVHQEAAGDDHGLAREESRTEHGSIDGLILSATAGRNQKDKNIRADVVIAAE